MIPEHIIEKIKEQNDIVDVISESVRLKKTGKSYKGLCPFHGEKTPSFNVSSEKQFFKCFGCGEAGNVISFIMKYKNLSYIEAIRYLAERANITIEENNETSKIRDNKEIFYTINKEVGRYFFNNLQNTNNEGKAYFLRRGISEATIRKFGLGYARDGWNNLRDYLKSKGYNENILEKAGLIIKSEKNRSYYDRFRNRVMFPVFDYKGRVIAFGGRVLDDSKPKYLNSPETPVFNKGNNLYGLNYAIKNNNLRTIVIVEGYMDVISLHQYGITNVVASLGTALTVNQARLLKRYADKIIISYDADLAGQMATLRGLEILRANNFDVRVLTVPNGKDPDEFIRANGKDAFLKLMDNSIPLIDYRISRAKEGINFKKREDVIKYSKNVMEILADLDSVEKDVYVKKISEETSIKEEALYELLNAEVKKNTSKFNEMNISEDFRQKLYVENGYIKAVRGLLKFLLVNKVLNKYIYDTLEEEDFVFKTHKDLFKLIKESQDVSDKKARLSYIEARCQDIDTTKEWVNINEVSLFYDEGQEEKLIEDYIKEINEYNKQETVKKLMKQIKEYEAKGMIEESIKLVLKLKELQSNIGRG